MTFSLWVSWYNPKNAQRAEELLYVLKRNLENPFIHEINVIEEETREGLFPHPKLKPVCLDKPSRLSFGEIFELVSAQISGPVIVANSDIFFDSTLALIQPYQLEGKFFCLARRDVKNKQSSEVPPLIWNAFGSHDAWIFNSPLRFDKLALSFSKGCFQCDGRLAYEMKRAGYRVINPSKSINLFHLHQIDSRNWGLSVEGPLLNVYPDDLLFDPKSPAKIGIYEVTR